MVSDELIADKDNIEIVRCTRIMTIQVVHYLLSQSFFYMYLLICMLILAKRSTLDGMSPPCPGLVFVGSILLTALGTSYSAHISSHTPRYGMTPSLRSLPNGYDASEGLLKPNRATYGTKIVAGLTST